MTSVFIHNFGCRVNQAEAFDWSCRLGEAGIAVARDWHQADWVVVNACALTARAEADVRQFLKRVRRESPGTRIVVTGCLADKTREELAGNSAVCRVIPNFLKENLVGELLKLTGAGDGRAEKRFFRSRALIKVQDGCDSHCTFCIIPSLRGKSRSRPLEQVVECAREAAERGYKEIVLAGIHLCAYGRDLEPEKSLLDLLRALTAIEELRLVRLSSLDPRLLPEPLLGYLAKEEKICPHFHLSLQHASEPVLRRMGRKSTPAGYLEILSFLRAGRPEAGLGADIIVGFPGEEEADFEFMRDFLKSSPLNYFHVFSYSPRAGTPAAGWKQVPENVKKKRSEELRKLSREKNLAFRAGFVGRALAGVVIKKRGSRLEVLTGNYIKVMVEDGRDLRPGQDVLVRITEAGPALSKGEVV
ncbi:MAG: tRNA-t(6)A37 methylthiotransferase [Candidatus Saccharicenans subterraneus]|uniref:tRNA-t(6)A37 methylthiotransferase n=1 Tax=Candidatus Saccharicenans subterraneus TaxID=2508984 RepID=A0A3E2BNI2_9BACT|nr:MAG: tRNA-t(6)A37 methylthiotransferase [Candidatus Saccharicenans subterraneum]